MTNSSLLDPGAAILKTIAEIAPILIMKVSESDVRYVAELAHLELTAEERKTLLRDLNSILDYVDTLNELDTRDVHPMAQLVTPYDSEKSGAEPFGFASRDDIPEGLRKSLPREIALGNAPDTDGVFFRVPKVIEREG
jgi:aspartyl-tRNA(Asn)/glutamyl-tRNA(Gln) amidotransferase subunit C